MEWWLLLGGTLIALLLFIFSSVPIAFSLGSVSVILAAIFIGPQGMF